MMTETTVRGNSQKAIVRPTKPELPGPSGGKGAILTVDESDADNLASWLRNRALQAETFDLAHPGSWPFYYSWRDSPPLPRIHRAGRGRPRLS